jgi:penicillin-insensitive murein endopeptidase
MKAIRFAVSILGALLAMAEPTGGGWAAEAPVPRTYDEAMALIRRSEEAKRSRPSRSLGKVDSGSLEHPAVLPFEGYGFVIATRRHRGRDLRYGTDDLVYGLAEVAATLAKDRPGAPRLVVGNIGRRKGGPISYSFSHQNGRDVDLAFFVTDAAGRPYEPADLVVIDSGRTLAGTEEGSGKRCKLDLARQWELTVALLECRRFGDRIERMYIWDPIRERLLEHGRAWAEKAADAAERARREKRVRQAASLMSQPSHAGAHDDHLHLRIGPRREG